MAGFSQAEIESVQSKVQDFYEALPADERPVLEAVMAAAAGPEVAGFLKEVDPSPAFIFKAGLGLPLTIPLPQSNPGLPDLGTGMGVPTNHNETFLT